MSDTLSKIQEALSKREERAKAIPCSVLVWGPGDEPFLNKRRQIAKKLIEDGFDAHLSEDVTSALPSTVGTVAHEDIQWREFDLILVLDFGPGPGFELALFGTDRRFINKTIVCHPHHWDPVVNSSMGSSVLAEFHNRWTADDSEIASCDILRSFIYRAKAFRASSLPRSRTRRT